MTINEEVFNFMNNRRSAPIRELCSPGPSQNEIQSILKIASRTPDHGKLSPWRFILYKGKYRHSIGEKLAAIAKQNNCNISNKAIEIEKKRFNQAPLVIGVISTPNQETTIPAWEMHISAGMVAMNLMIAANALGYGTNLLTHWYSYDETAKSFLGIKQQESVVGFIHTGSFNGEYVERKRPNINDLVHVYNQ